MPFFQVSEQFQRLGGRSCGAAPIAGWAASPERSVMGRARFDPTSIEKLSTCIDLGCRAESGAASGLCGLDGERIQ